MSSTQKFLLRALSVALVAAPLAAAAGCSEGDLDLLFGDDGGTPDASVDASPFGEGGTPDVTDPDSGKPSTKTCGNGKLDPGEECDDKNTASNDGCSSSCKWESAGPGDLCSTAIEIPLVQHDGGTLYTASVAGDTSLLYHQYAAVCGGGSGADAVYKVTSPTIGRVVARVTAPFPAIISGRTACDDAKTEVACKDNTSVSASTTEIAFPIYANTPVYFFVDGFGGTKGTFTLDLEVQTAFCGNGHAEYPEACDDGNTADGDGCSSTCALEDTSAPSTCPGMPYRISGTASFAGDTSALENGGGTATGCVSDNGSGSNAVYALTPTMTGALKLDLLANYPEALLHVRRECSGTSNASQFDCTGAPEALVPLTMTIPVFAEQTIFAFVDGSDGNTGGLYTLEATLTAAACGNGVVDGGEECDDGNTADDDGCSATCMVERDPAAYTCPGQSIELKAATPDVPGPRTLRVRGTTAPAPGETVPANKWGTTSPAARCQAGGRDVVYELTSDIDGFLEGTVSGGLANLFGSLRAECKVPETANPLSTCSKDSTGNAPKTFHAAVNKGTKYYVVVDGNASGAEGPFVLDLEVTPSVCGNGVIEGGETCDDGAIDDGDGCSATCQVETDKTRDTCQTALPVTLTSNPNGTYTGTIVSGTTGLASNVSLTGCTSPGPDAYFSVTPEESGVLTARISSAQFNSVIGARTGPCTGGSQIKCSSTTGLGGQEITFPVTGGTTYYLIVDAKSTLPNFGRFTMDVTIVPTGCGDGVRSDPEQCDDGNLANGDGCSSGCTLEPLTGSNACPGYALSLTGPGMTPRKAVLTLDTSTQPSNTAGSCGGSGPESIVEITSDIDGLLDVTGTAVHSLLLYGRTTCGDPATETPKSGSNPCTTASAQRTVSAAVKKGVAYYLFVDGINGAAGVSQLQITVTP